MSFKIGNMKVETFAAHFARALCYGITPQGKQMTPAQAARIIRRAKRKWGDRIRFEGLGL